MRAWFGRPLPIGMWFATCLVIGLLFAGFTILWTNASLDAHDAKNAAARQKEGRAIAIDVLCGFGNGVAEAGRKALAGELEGQSGRGLPQKSQDDYVATVNGRLLSAAGVKAADVLIGAGRNRGLIDCAKLRVAAKATRP